MSLPFSELGDKYNFIGLNKIHHEHGNGKHINFDERDEEGEDERDDIFPIYSFSRFAHIGEEDLSELENKSMLTRQIMATGLSGLKRRGDGLSLVELQLSKRRLKDVSILREYNELTRIDLSHNRISEIDFLDGNAGIQHLDLAHNCIIQPPKSAQRLRNLKTLNLSNNRIAHIPDNYSRQFHFLTCLNLSSNRIAEMNWLSFSHLKHLRTLDLSGNKLKKLETLTNFNIRELYAQRNQISECVSGDNGLFSNRHLILIDVSHNRLSTLGMCKEAFSLRHINVSHNRIGKVTELEHLRNLRELQDLNLSGNPVNTANLYEKHVQFICKYLETFNEEFIPFEVRGTYCLDRKKKFWNDFLKHHGTNIKSLNNYLLSENTIYKACISQSPHVLIVLVGTTGCFVPDICNAMDSEFPNVHVLYIVTTNPMECKNYINVTNGKYEALEKRGHFIVSREEYGFMYGYRREEIQECFQHHKVCLADINLKGALSLKAFGLEPYIILVTIYSEDDQKENLLRNMNFVENQGSCMKLIPVEKSEEVMKSASHSDKMDTDISNSSLHEYSNVEKMNDIQKTGRSNTNDVEKQIQTDKENKKRRQKLYFCVEEVKTIDNQANIVQKQTLHKNEEQKHNVKFRQEGIRNIDNIQNQLKKHGKNKAQKQKMKRLCKESIKTMGDQTHDEQPTLENNKENKEEKRKLYKENIRNFDQRAGSICIMNKLFPNEGTVKNASDLIHDILKEAELNEELYNEHREQFYSSVKMRDLPDGVHKMRVLIDSILKNKNSIFKN